MAKQLFSNLLSIDIIGLYPPFQVQLELPGADQKLCFSDALCAWKREHRCDRNPDARPGEHESVRQAQRVQLVKKIAAVAGKR